MAKCLFKWIMRTLWNIQCGNVSYFHWPSCEHPTGVISLAEASISDVTTALTKKYQKKTFESHEVD